MPKFVMGDAVDGDFVQTEFAHQIHRARHKGDNYFCQSDEVIAERIGALLRDRGWVVIPLPKVEAAP